jgi:hypothetical protein
MLLVSAELLHLFRSFAGVDRAPGEECASQLRDGIASGRASPIRRRQSTAALAAALFRAASSTMVTSRASAMAIQTFYRTCQKPSVNVLVEWTHKPLIRLESRSRFIVGF